MSLGTARSHRSHAMPESVPKRVEYFRLSYRRWLLAALLWLGLVLCILVLYQLGPEVASMYARLGWPIWAACSLCMLIAWACLAMAWRETVAAIAGLRLSRSTAARQLGLLLVGKYAPGGVFGFLARIYDGDGTSLRASLAAAGLFEQMLGLSVLTATGAVLYVAGTTRMAWPLIGLLPIAWLAVVACRVVLRGLRLLPIAPLRVTLGALHNSSTRQQGILCAAALTQASVLGWMAIVMLLAMVGFDLDLLPAVGVAGAFAVAMTAGILALFAPGGIGVREAAMVALTAPWLELDAALILAASLRLLSVAFDLWAGSFAALLSFVQGYAPACRPPSKAE